MVHLDEAKAREEAQKQQAAALAAAEKRAADAEEQKSQAQIRVSELEYSLTAASERDVGMSNLLSSLVMEKKILDFDFHALERMVAGYIRGALGGSGPTTPPRST